MSRLIDADAMEKTILDFWGCDPAYCMDLNGWDPAMADVCTLERLKNAPAIDAVPVVRGKWIEHGRDRPPTCSNCGSGCLLNYESDYHKSDYCPHCGADMREEADHD